MARYNIGSFDQFSRFTCKNVLEQHGHVPETVREAELIFHDVAVADAGMGILPFVGTESRYDEHTAGDESVSSKDIEPDVNRQRTHERKQARRHALGQLEENTDAQVHVGFREINHAFTRIVDRHRRHRQICILEFQKIINEKHNFGTVLKFTTI